MSIKALRPSESASLQRVFFMTWELQRTHRLDSSVLICPQRSKHVMRGVARRVTERQVRSQAAHVNSKNIVLSHTVMPRRVCYKK